MREPSPTLAVLLDLDGTLLDSNDAHARSWEAVFARHGRPVAFERIRPLIGMGADKLLSTLLGLHEAEPLAKAVVEDRRVLFLERWLPGLRPTPGARAFVEHLVAEDIGVVLATSSGEEELRALLRQAGVDDLIETTTTTADAAHSKPDPDILAAALRKAGVRPTEAMMVGDTPYDIDAARAAGVDTIALRCGGAWDDAALAGAEAVYDDPADLLAAWDRSPIGRRRNPGG